MKNSYYYIIFLLISSCIVVSPKLENHQIKHEIKIEESKIFDQLNSKDNPEWLSITNKIKITKNDNVTHLNASFIIRKDSIIWGSIRAGIGIEIMRFLIDPDTIKHLDRIKKSYSKRHISTIEKILNANINLTDLQGLLYSNPKFLFDQNKFKISDLDGKYLITSDFAEYVVDKEKMKIERLNFVSENEQELEITYSDYISIQEFYFPRKTTIRVTGEEQFTAEINSVKVKKESIKKVNFKVPKSYDKIQ